MRLQCNLVMWLALGSHAAFGAEGATSAKELLDEAIWWPGDFGQVCRGDGSHGPFAAPHIPSRGAALTQEFFLSKAMIKRLRAHRAEISAEIVARLKAFDWRFFPKGDPLSGPAKEKAVQAIEKAEKEYPGGAMPQLPRKPENNRALGPQMVLIIQETGAVEALPELLRLEGELNEINQVAMEEGERYVKNGEPKVPTEVCLPPIESGGWAVYDEWMSEWAALGRPEESRWLAWKSRVFENIHFQAQILAVILELVKQRDAVALKESMVGRLMALGERRRDDMPWADELPWTGDVRGEVRRLAECLVSGQKPKASLKGEALLDTLIRRPGDFSQLCDVGPTMTINVTLPSLSHLKAKEHSFSDDDRMRMQAFRDSLVPVLIRRLAAMDVSKPNKNIRKSTDERNSGQRGDELGPLLLEVLEVTQAIECLPEILRLERELHDLVTKALADKKAPVPDLPLHASVILLDDPEKLSSIPTDERRWRIFNCAMYQRELLSLMKTLLVREEYAPMTGSQIVRDLREAGEKAMAPELAEIHAEHEIPSYWSGRVKWDRESEKAILREGVLPQGDIPYTDAVRAEIRTAAERFLKEVPPEKWKGADGMVLRWLERPW